MRVIIKKKVHERDFFVFEKSENYFSVSYYADEEVEITSATSKSKAKKKLELIIKAYELGYRDGWN